MSKREKAKRGFRHVQSHGKRVNALVRAWDRAGIGQIGKLPQGEIDRAMLALTNAANHSKLWIGSAAAMYAVKGNPRQAAIRGLLSVGVASAITSGVLKRVLPRRRPHEQDLPVFRFLNPQPGSSSLPSGHSASAFAFATAVTINSPRLGLVFVPLAAAVAYSRVHTGAHWPSDVLIGSALGVGCGFLTRHWWTLRPPIPHRELEKGQRQHLPESGEGMLMVVNPHGGSYTEGVEGWLHENMPEATFVELREGHDLKSDILTALADDSRLTMLGVWGGDGTAGTVADVAADKDLPLMVMPGGTFNHYARDVAVESPDSALEAARLGRVVRSDLGQVTLEFASGATKNDGDASPSSRTVTMLNTASVGVYPELVRRRERLEGVLGKPVAGLLAGLETFVRARPTVLNVGGGVRKVWMVFVGRGRYYPEDLAPLVRPSINDGLLDIRSVSASLPWAQVRTIWAALTGTLERSKATVFEHKPTFEASSDVPFSFAVDGEVYDNATRVQIRVEPKAIDVYSFGI
ncbi:bifunctional phosphatase PAP2/diacylglycerol kinase family protein [Haematomicrobium sanguinis]|uniref:bifunctional phosphatase PAP2/diacylglycerol kinase family protein n=1 Tax=Haematomicrobium sanguinis TaxID=479106 RepID=UPI000690C800|nr:bifunctional phosphatase PAP2/diacylglycerol kinase family protein [Haematomicrobium sanguinis]